jgi:hypothetical protein
MHTTKNIHDARRSKNSLTPLKLKGRERSVAIKDIFPTKILRQYKVNKIEKIQTDLLIIFFISIFTPQM